MDENIPLLDRITPASSTEDLVLVKQPTEKSVAFDTQTPPLTVFQAAQEGDLQLLTQYISNGTHSPNDLDADGCTVLHWAAIVSLNNDASILISA